MDIIDSLQQMDNSILMAREHALSGHLYKLNSNPHHENDYVQQMAINHFYLNEYKRIQNLAHQKGFLFEGIKGISLMEEIYQDPGERKISDIDIYTNNEGETTKLLLESGYKLIGKEGYKLVYTKILDSNEIVFEIHTHLYEDNNISLIMENNNISDLEHLYFLIYHLSYQHTFLRLNWFIDIVKFIEVKRIDLFDLITLSKKRGHEKSFKLTFYFLAKFFNLKSDFSNINYPYFIDQKFLLSPYRNKIIYFYVKHATKQSIVKSIQYDFKWLLKYFKSKSPNFPKALTK